MRRPVIECDVSAQMPDARLRSEHDLVTVYWHGPAGELAESQVGGAEEAAAMAGAGEGRAGLGGAGQADIRGPRCDVSEDSSDTVIEGEVVAEDPRGNVSPAVAVNVWIVSRPAAPEVSALRVEGGGVVASI
ncbi:MAG TPA: hypothetical protein PKC49_00325 [Phycisphaerae bacterium]|nr:hypothetical protein [Phycisphaerae bacterium]